MTNAEKTGHRQEIAAMIQEQLKAHPEGMGPGRLVRTVVLSSKNRQHYTAAIDVQSTLFDLISTGVAEWTKKGPVRLRSESSLTNPA